VTSLWREIERHGSLTDVQPESGTANKLAGKLALLRPEAAHPDQAAARARRRRASTGKSH
jgi:hypothetical protein